MTDSTLRGQTPKAPPFVSRVYHYKHAARTRELTHPRHRHNRTVHELTYIDYGAMTLFVGADAFHLTVGQCLFIPGPSQHAFEADAGMPFNYLNLMFYGSPPPELFKKVFTVDRAGAAVIDRLRRETADDLPYHQQALVGALTDLIVTILRQPEGHKDTPSLPPAYLRHHHHRVTSKALSIIAGHYHEPLKLEQVCRAVGISPSRLHVRLKSDVGKTFSELLHAQRITVAKRLLLDTDMAMAEVAAAVGYQSRSFFFNIFKRIAGMTPAAYARSLGDPMVNE